jgi:hypothetical protein
MLMIKIKLNIVLDQCSEKINIIYYRVSLIRNSVIADAFGPKNLGSAFII